MASPDGPPPPVSNPITGTWRNSFADKDKKDRVLSLRTMNVQKVIYSEKGNPLSVINGAKFFKASVMKDGKTRRRCTEKF
jgi:hypothetical protein